MYKRQKQKQTHNVGIKQQPGNEVKKEEKEQEKEQEMLTPSTANVEQAFHPHMETSKLEVPKKQVQTMEQDVYKRQVYERQSLRYPIISIRYSRRYYVGRFWCRKFLYF